MKQSESVKEHVRALLDVTNSLITDAKLIYNTLSEHLKSVFVNEDHSLIPDFLNRTDISIADVGLLSID